MAKNERKVEYGVIQSATPYYISRDLLARMVAGHTSGAYNAIPEQDDFDRADEMIALLNEKIAQY
jgi:hypothetical protein